MALTCDAILKGYPDWADEPGEPDHRCSLDAGHEGLHITRWRERHWGEWDDYEWSFDDEGKRAWP